MIPETFCLWELLLRQMRWRISFPPEILVHLGGILLQQIDDYEEKVSARTATFETRLALNMAEKKSCFAVKQ